VDAACPLAAADPEEGREEVDALAAAPAVLALVDACWGGEGEAQAVASALAAALEALPPEARFGLVSFGSQVGPRTALQRWRRRGAAVKAADTSPCVFVGGGGGP
jgi:hypothetical protein